MARWMRTQETLLKITSTIAHCTLPCGMNHNLWDLRFCNKKAVTRIQTIGKIKCYVSTISITVLHPPVTPGLKDPRVETFTAA